MQFKRIDSGLGLLEPQASYVTRPLCSSKQKAGGGEGGGGIFFN